MKKDAKPLEKKHWQEVVSNKENREASKTWGYDWVPKQNKDRLKTYVPVNECDH